MGRKDPMLPGNGIGDTDKTCYTTNDNYKFKYGSEGLNTTDIKEYIRNPHKFNLKPEMDGVYYNLWSTDNDKTVPNDDVVIKSVYDPSPVGYSLPASNAFTGFTTTGQNVGSWPNPLTPEQLAQLNVKGEFDKGWDYYCKAGKTGETLFFPASGGREHGNGNLSTVNTGAGLWTEGANSLHHSWFLSFTSERISPLFTNSRDYGLSVRSAEEKKLKCWL